MPTSHIWSRSRRRPFAGWSGRSASGSVLATCPDRVKVSDRKRASAATGSASRIGIIGTWCSRSALRQMLGSECSAMFFRKHVGVKIGDPLLTFLRDAQVPECVADIGADGFPKERRIRCPQVVRTLIAEFLANACFAKFREQRRSL